MCGLSQTKVRLNRWCREVAVFPSQFALSARTARRSKGLFCTACTLFPGIAHFVSGGRKDLTMRRASWICASVSSRPKAGMATAPDLFLEPSRI